MKRLKNCHRLEEDIDWGDMSTECSMDWILKQEEDITANTSESQIKSRFLLKKKKKEWHQRKSGC